MARVIPVSSDDEFREFVIVLRSALLMIVRWIERRYMTAEEAKATPLDSPGRVIPN
jgi:hypothetical protein